MSTALLQPDTLVAYWRTSGENNPAGPLFSTPYAEADLTLSELAIRSTDGCSSCTASRTAQCC
jgi:hypothetical protein